jgi:tetratricopeptide (TPR) repeat protein
MCHRTIHKFFIHLTIFLYFTLHSANVFGQKESNDVRVGNKLYQAKKYTESEIAFRRGIVKNQHSIEATYNLGNSLFRQSKFPEAIEQYKQAVQLKPESKKLEASCYHNLGNALLSNQKIEESIKAYKMALKANPSDNETRYNLAYAQALLKNKDKNNNNNKKDNKQDKQQQQQQEQQEQQDQQKKEQHQQNQNQMSKENAQQILDALQQDEKNTHDKAKKQQAKGIKKADKDW